MQCYTVALHKRLVSAPVHAGYVPCWVTYAVCYTGDNILPIHVPYLTMSRVGSHIRYVIQVMFSTVGSHIRYVIQVMMSRVGSHIRYVIQVMMSRVGSHIRYVIQVLIDELRNDLQVSEREKEVLRKEVKDKEDRVEALRKEVQKGRGPAR